MPDRPPDCSSDGRGRRLIRHDEIARRARELWERKGHPVGRDEQIWLEAERELRGLTLTSGEIAARLQQARRAPPSVATTSAAPREALSWRGRY